jgi:hypothetical protein
MVELAIQVGQTMRSWGRSKPRRRSWPGSIGCILQVGLLGLAAARRSNGALTETLKATEADLAMARRSNHALVGSLQTTEAELAAARSSNKSALKQ